MDQNKKKYLLYILVLAMLSCKSSKEDIEQVRVKFGPEETTVMVPVTCESIDYIFPDSLLKQKTITDKRFLEKLGKELSSLEQASEERNVDIRMKLLIDYPKKTDTLCLGEFFNVVLNGKLMDDNPELLNLVKSEVY
ncbi:hypothetical protein [Nafulsella turpanensis]|uniref:hypothetical protein n=1 Tax=Nafulsella turpanensis TaxID=1265690 RepID=UPI00035D23DF|nr:hypothetical protein [Nafulsella turpanensis]